MEIEYLKAHNGSRKGDVLNVIEGLANDLIGRKIARPVPSSAELELVKQKVLLDRQAKQIKKLKARLDSQPGAKQQTNVSNKMMNEATKTK